MTDRKHTETGTIRLLFSVAVRNLRRHWVRSLLATIGIIIGVIAIASLGILGNSITLLLGGFWADVGDALLITPHLAISSGDPGDPRNILPSTLTDREVAQIEKAAGLENRVIPMIRSSEMVRFGDKTGYAMLYALESEDIQFLLDTESGTYPKGGSASVLMGTFLADEFDIKAGSRITLGNASVRVVGIVAERGWGVDINPDFAVIVTQDWYEEQYGEKYFNQVVVKVRDVNDIERVKNSINSQLNRKKEVIDILDSKEIMELFNDTLAGINILLIGIGAVSLFVASVSILNVMIISVTERTQEIGVMRSIGTHRREVMLMFLFEALILGLVGSFIGGLLSSLVGYIVSRAVIAAFADLFGTVTEVSVLDPAILGYILFGIGFGLIASILAGFYPAWKAARLNPIDALRYE
jgi:putative ABC transport system permease protein